jgi:PAS domain-containing protein
LKSNRHPDQIIGSDTSHQPPSADDWLHDRLRAQLPPGTEASTLSPSIVADLLLTISEAYREHDRITARLSQELHVEVARRERVMTRLRRITLQLLGSAGAAPDLAGGTDLEHLSELIARLVHDREEAKQQLSKSEERFRALTENALDITAIVSPQGRIDYASPSIEPVMGYAPGDC